MLPGDQTRQSVDGIEKMLMIARAGERSQLGHLLDIYRSYLLTVATDSLARDITAKVAPSDLVQETLMQASIAFPNFRGTTDLELRGWLTQILKRKAIDVHRHYRRYSKRDISREIPLFSSPRSDDHTLDTLGCVVPPSARAQAAENVRIMQDALNRLTPEHRQVIQLRNIEQVDFEEIARRLGRSPGAVRKLWTRAVQNLTVELRSDESSPIR